MADFRPCVFPPGASQRARGWRGIVIDAEHSRQNLEVPSLLRGARLSKIFGREGIITFESNGAFVLARGKGWPRVILPGLRDIRGYQAMYRDWLSAIRDGRAPEMSLERAMEDHRLMDQIYASLGRAHVSS